MTARTYRSWGECGECGFHGLVEFSCRAGEDYGDPDSLGVMMDSLCPACGQEEAVLVTTEEFREMCLEARG